MALALVSAGADEEALALTPALDRLGAGADAVRLALARRHADRGDLTRALQVSGEARGRWLRELRARSGLAAVREAVDDGALDRAALIDSPEWRATAQVEVARRVAARGRPSLVDAALRAASESVQALPWVHPRCRSARDVTLAYLELGRASLGVSFLDALRAQAAELDEAARGPYLGELACLYLQLGQPGRGASCLDDARVVARRGPDGTMPAWVALCEARTGLPDALGSLAEHGGGADRARAEIGELRLAAGDLSGALLAAAAMEGRGGVWIELLRRIARAYAERGALVLSLEVADQIGDGFLRAATYLDVARVLATAGDVARAWEVAEQSAFDGFDLREPRSWPSVALGISGITTQLGFELWAQRSLCESAMRCRLALGWVGSEPFAQAFDGADEHVRLVARLHGELGSQSDAGEWIDRLREPRSRAWALLGLAKGLLARRGTS